MKLSYKTPGSAGGWTVLADEADRVTTLELFAPSFSVAGQVEPLTRGSTVATFDRGNVAAQLQIVATVTYGSYALAFDSFRVLREAFNGKRHLKLEEGTKVQYYPHALLTSYVPVPSGVTVRHQLQFTSQDLTTTEPS